MAAVAVAVAFDMYCRTRLEMADQCLDNSAAAVDLLVQLLGNAALLDLMRQDIDSPAQDRGCSTESYVDFRRNNSMILVLSFLVIDKIYWKPSEFILTGYL